MIDLGVLVLRIGLGFMFAAHGLQKAFGVLGGPGVKNLAKYLAGLGFHPGILWAYMVANVELIGGLLLILGFYTRGASALLFVVMLVAALKVHLKNGFFLQSGGFEYTFVIACALLTLIFTGAGKYSLLNKF